MHALNRITRSIRRSMATPSGFVNPLNQATVGSAASGDAYANVCTQLAPSGDPLPPKAVMVLRTMWLLDQAELAESPLANAIMAPDVADDALANHARRAKAVWKKFAEKHAQKDNLISAVRTIDSYASTLQQAAMLQIAVTGKLAESIAALREAVKKAQAASGAATNVRGAGAKLKAISGADFVVELERLIRKVQAGNPQMDTDDLTACWHAALTSTGF